MTIRSFARRPGRIARMLFKLKPGQLGRLSFAVPASIVRQVLARHTTRLRVTVIAQDGAQRRHRKSTSAVVLLSLS